MRKNLVPILLVGLWRYLQVQCIRLTMTQASEGVKQSVPAQNGNGGTGIKINRKKLKAQIRDQPAGKRAIAPAHRELKPFSDQMG